MHCEYFTITYMIKSNLQNPKPGRFKSKILKSFTGLMPAKGMNIHLQLDVHQGLQRFDTPHPSISRGFKLA